MNRIQPALAAIGFLVLHGWALAGTPAVKSVEAKAIPVAYTAALPRSAVLTELRPQLHLDCLTVTGEHGLRHPIISGDVEG